MVELKDVVNAFPKKLDDNPNFSAGEAQLLQLARVLLKKAKIVVLDECTASIDVSSDRVIQRTIAEQFSGATKLTIAHRIETILTSSDRILLLEQGCVAEVGSPLELLNIPNGQFRSLAEQSLGRDKLLNMAASRS